MKLTDECRRLIIDKLIGDRVDHLKDYGEMESQYTCDMHNGFKGYMHYTDEELLQDLVFLKWGFDLEFYV